MRVAADSSPTAQVTSLSDACERDTARPPLEREHVIVVAVLAQKVLIIRTYVNYEHIRSGTERRARFLLGGRSFRPLPRLTWFVRLR